MLQGGETIRNCPCGTPTSSHFALISTCHPRSLNIPFDRHPTLQDSIFRPLTASTGSQGHSMLSKFLKSPLQTTFKPKFRDFRPLTSSLWRRDLMTYNTHL